MQVINDTSFGGEIGKALGGGLRDLAQYKLQSLQEPYQRMLQQKRAMEGTREIFGDQGAQFYASLDPNAQKEFLKNPLPFLKLLQAGGLNGLGGGMQQLSQGIPGQQGQIPMPGGQPMSQPGQNIPNTGVLSPELLQQIQQQQQQGGQQQGNPNQDAQNQLEDIFSTPEQKLNRLKTLQPELVALQDKGRPARESKKTAQDALAILSKNKAKTGIWGKITPTFMQSKEGQEMVNLFNKLVLQQAQKGKGLPTEARLSLEQGAKANIWQHPKVIENILNRIIDDPEDNLDIARAQAADELQQKYGGSLPNDILAQINKRAKQLYTPSKKSSSSSQFTKDSLPSASNLKNGQRAKNPETGEYEYVVKNGKWEKYNG